MGRQSSIRGARRRIKARIDELRAEVEQCERDAKGDHAPEIIAHLNWQIGRKRTEVDALEHSLRRMTRHGGDGEI